jgi:hypothetical protein
MTEETKKAKKFEPNYHDVVVELDPGEKYVITAVGASANSPEKYNVAWVVPQTDRAAIDRYDVENGLIDLVEMGVRQLSTRPNYQAAGFNMDAKFTTTTEDGVERTDAPLVENGHALMQQAADDYRVGRTRTAAPKLTAEDKAAMKELKAISAKSGLSPAELLERIKAANIG